MRQYFSTKLNRPALRAAAIALFAVVIPVLELTAGVLVAPTVVFMSHKQRTGRMTVQNPTDQPKEVTISFSFGLPTSDSLGNVHVHLRDSGVTDPNSALGWIKAFPRKMILPPNQSQVVRFVASPPPDAPEGEYWARVIIESREGETTLPTAGDEDAITTKLNMVMQTAIMLKFRKGDLATGIAVTDTSIVFHDDAVDILLGLERRGTASYVGVLNANLYDADDKKISGTSLQLAVYYDLYRRVTLPVLEGDWKRPFRVEVEITTEGRNDIADTDMITGNEVTMTQVLQ